MLSGANIKTAVNPVQILKQGYLQKKGGSGFLAKWRSKFVSVVMDNGSVFFRVEDKRNQSIPPKHRVILSDSHLEIPNNIVAIKLSMSGNNTRGHDSKYLIILHGTKRKYLFSAQTRRERDEWVYVLSQYCGVVTNEPTTSTKLPLTPDYAYEIQRSKSPAFSTMLDRPRYTDDDDAMSTFSDDSCFSTNTGNSIRPGPSAPPVEYFDGRSLNSTFETLSFCSEPVMTPQELAHIGKSNRTFRRDDSPARKRINPNMIVNSQIPRQDEWNFQYQKILLHATHSEEAYLKKDLQLIDTVGSFKEIAQYHVKTYVDSFHVKNKTGESPWSFHREGINFQLLVNYESASLNDIQSAYLQANHELQATNMINSVGESVHTVLSCIIDYKGIRVLAHSDYKAGHCSLVYDLEHETPALDENITNILSIKGELLNLKPHTVMLKNDKKYVICGSSGIQGHYSKAINITYLTHLHTIIPVDCNGSSEPSMNYRLRGEFLQHYPSPLSADAFSEWSSSFKNERESNDVEVLNASKYLKEHWIPSFVKTLDYLQIRPVNSRELSNEFHKAGINMRYLGSVAQISKLPFIKEFCMIEMVSRATKAIFQLRIRSAILHFRSVGATSIDEEMKNYAATLFTLVLGSNEKSIKFWEEKLREEVKNKFSFTLLYDQLSSLSRPALFLSLQYHCGIIFEDDSSYDFSQVIPKSKIVAFVPKAKSVWEKAPELVNYKSETIPENNRFSLEELVAFGLSRHFKSLGSTSKYSRLDSSASALMEVAAFYNSSGRFEEGKLYAQSACNAALNNTCIYGLAQSQLMESISGGQLKIDDATEQELLSIYKHALERIEWHYGKDNVWTMTLHDRLSSIYLQCKRPEKALEYLSISLTIATKSLGKSHPLTAGYKVKSGILFVQLKLYDDALSYLSEALHVFLAVQADLKFISEAHFHIAEILYAKGDIDGAIIHSQKCKKLREKEYGQQHIRTVEVYIQLSRLISSPYKAHKGVITPQIRSAFKEVITCDEKVFRYLKAQYSQQNSQASTFSSKRSMSSMSIASNARSTHSKSSQRASAQEKICATPLAGPLFSSPYTPTPTLSKKIFHNITKQIVRLKIELLELSVHKEHVRTLRMMNQENGLDSEEARKVVAKLTAVSPSIYMDGIMARVEDEDEEAIRELGVVLQLTENEVVGVQE